MSYIVLSLLLITGTARAQDDGPAPDPREEPPAEIMAAPDPPEIVEARERIALGEGAFDRGDYGAALVEFERAYELLDGKPIRYLVLYNLGQCYERLFQYGRAMDAYQQYLREGGEAAEDRATVEATIRTLEGLLGTVRVSVNVQGAEIWVDDQLVGEPGDVLLPAGPHVVEARAVGHLPARREVRVAARSEQSLALALEPIPEEDPGIDSAFFYTSVAVAGVAAAVGTFFGIMALTLKGDADAALEGGPSTAGYWQIDQSDRDDIDRTALVADVLFGSAVVFGVTAGVLYFMTDFGGDEDAPSPTASIAPVLSPNGGGLVLRGAL